MAAPSTAPGPATGPGREDTSKGDYGIITQAAAAAEVTVVPGSALQIIAAVNEQHRVKELHADQTIQQAIRCGDLLIDQKQRIPHWQFSKWVEQNCVFSVQTARDYMRIAESVQSDSALPFLSIRIRQTRARPSDHATLGAQPATTEQAADSTQIPTSSDTMIAIHRAISILDEARLVGNHNKLLSAYRSATNELKRLRQQLGRGEIAQRNAEASVIKAATCYTQKLPQS